MTRDGADPDRESGPGGEPDPDRQPDDRTVRCPFCGSTDTRLAQRTGTGLCRTVYVCADCREPFEEFG